MRQTIILTRHQQYHTGQVDGVREDDHRDAKEKEKIEGARHHPHNCEDTNYSDIGGW